MDYSPWGHKESDTAETTEQLSASTMEKSMKVLQKIKNRTVI